VEKSLAEIESSQKEAPMAQYRHISALVSETLEILKADFFGSMSIGIDTPLY
jgi:hypothetical protein